MVTQINKPFLKCRTLWLSQIPNTLKNKAHRVFKWYNLRLVNYFKEKKNGTHQLCLKSLNLIIKKYENEPIIRSASLISSWCLEKTLSALITSKKLMGLLNTESPIQYCMLKSENGHWLGSICQHNCYLLAVVTVRRKQVVRLAPSFR